VDTARSPDVCDGVASVCRRLARGRLDQRVRAGGGRSAAVQGRAVATYTDPSVYRVGPTELRRLTDELDPESPQRAILADGRVSRAEVGAAWQAYAQCMRAAGFLVTTSTWDPVTTTTRIFTFARAGTKSPATETSPTTPPTTPPTPTTPLTTPPAIDPMAPREEEQVDACEERYWFPVSAVYAADARPHMEPRLSSGMERCMVRRGYPVQGIADFGGMVGAVRGEARGERVQAGRDCLAKALVDLYPDLPYYPRP
jgi:hypothetical protein